MVISGSAGTGKSYFIKCLVYAIKRLFNSNKSVEVLRPTGNSANLISGVTLHSFLKEPTNFKSKGEMTRLMILWEINSKELSGCSCPIN